MVDVGLAKSLKNIQHNKIKTINEERMNEQGSSTHPRVKDFIYVGRNETHW